MCFNHFSHLMHFKLPLQKTEGSSFIIKTKQQLRTDEKLYNSGALMFVIYTQHTRHGFRPDRKWSRTFADC